MAKLHNAWWELDMAVEKALPEDWPWISKDMRNLWYASRDQLRRENRAKRWSGRP